MRTTNPVEAKVMALAEPIAEAMGYRIVRIRLSGLKRQRLQIMAERASDGGMGVEDCEALSRALSPALEEEDPIRGEYDLELSSPGIDRPLMRLEDFVRFAGHDAKLETTAMIEGRKRFKGVLVGVAGENIRLAMPEGEAQIPFSALHDARLILTDRLIEEDLRRSKKAIENSPPPRAGEVVSEANRRGEELISPLSHAARDSSPAGGGAKKQRKIQ